jgi:hypothetical protein
MVRSDSSIGPGYILGSSPIRPGGDGDEADYCGDLPFHNMDYFHLSPVLGDQVEDEVFKEKNKRRWAP